MASSPAKAIARGLLGLILVILCTFASGAYAQSIQKYFGYLGDDLPPNNLPDVKGHTNLFSIGNWTGSTTDVGRAGTTAYVLQQLALAKAAHVQAIVPGFAFVFQKQSNSSCWFNDPNASVAWNTFVQALIDNGYLIPGQPDQSTVAAIYLVDEPNLGPTSNVPQGNCLADVNGAANPALQNAISAIKNNPATSNVPVASILSVKFDNIVHGMQLLDWVGFDDYTQSEWAGYMQQLKSYVPNKKLILVPGAESGPGCVDMNDPGPYFNEMNNNPNAIWLAPFAWTALQSECHGVGVRDIPSLRATYTSYGQGIKAQGCASSDKALVFCRSALASFALSSGELHWSFVDASGDVYNLYGSPSSGYHFNDASAMAGAQMADDGALTSYALPSNEQHWGFIGRDGNVYNLSWSPSLGYAVFNTSAAAGAPRAAADALTSFALPSGEQHWAYIGINGDVYNLYGIGGSYLVDDASVVAGAPQAAIGALTSFTLPSGEQHWGYIGTNGHVYNLFWSSVSSYQINDATAAAGAPQAASGALTSFILPSGEQQWAYIGTNGHIYNLYWVAGSYHVDDASAAAGAPLAASGALTSFTLPSGEQHWGYIGTNGDVYNLYWSAGTYHVADASAAAAAPQAIKGALSSFALPSGEQHWSFTGTNGDVYDLYWNSGSYHVVDVSAAAGAP